MFIASPSISYFIYYKYFCGFSRRKTYPANDFSRLPLCRFVGSAKDRLDANNPTNMLIHSESEQEFSNVIFNNPGVKRLVYSLMRQNKIFVG